MEKALHLYKIVSQYPALVGARFVQDNVISTVWSERNIETGKSVKFTRHHILDYNQRPIKVSDMYPTDISEEVLSCYSPYENRVAIVREKQTAKDTRKQFLEVWNHGRLLRSVDLAALNVHGDVYTDVEFKSFSWSPEESRVIYIAEKKPPNREPFYKRKSKESSGDGTDGGSPIIGGEYVYRQDWGEQLVGKYQSVVAVYDFMQDDVKVLDGIPDNYCPAQVTWSPNTMSIIGIALETEPRKHGLVYCTNRSGRIFQLDSDGNLNFLSEKGKAVHSPRYSPDGKYLVWLQRDADGPHHACMKLMCIDVLNSDMSKPKVVVDVVKDSIKINNGKVFYGLYNTKFAERCWTSDNRRLLVSTPQKCAIKTYIIHIETSAITELEYNEGSQIFLDIFKDSVLVCREHYLQPSYCSIATLPNAEQECNIEWNDITSVEKPEVLENATFENFDISQENDDEIKDFTAIYFGPKGGQQKRIPLLVWPHGGPHGVFCASFLLEPSIYVAMNYAILFVNYRGSVGYGDANTRYLPGRIGAADVQDCMLALKVCLDKYPWINPEKLGLVGGSHGGFLVHQLSAQYPNKFRVVLSRNPVIDIASMSTTSDIPDWCAVEVEGENKAVDIKLFMKMREMSPIAQASKIQTPTYFMLGKKDMRVPFDQGLSLFYELKKNKVPVKLNLYDDNHQIKALPNEVDEIINGALWIMKYINE